MITIILNCFCDSIVARVCELLNINNQAVVENGPNCVDLWIVFVISAAIVWVAWIAKITVLGWKQKEIDLQNPNETNMSNENPQETALKLTERLLDFLKCQTMNYGDKGEFKSYKPIDKKECKIYTEVLVCLIEAHQNNDKKIQVEDLKKVLQQEETPKQ